MQFKESLFNILDSFPSSPFLFIGSGFSLRYLNTETWEGLLRKYSAEINRPFERYRSLAGGKWPEVGSLIAKDYHSFWFDSDSVRPLREKTLPEMVDFSSPLKVAISDYLEKASSADIKGEVVKELEVLRNAKISGIITTNYDLLCERIFPDYKVYKSQQELLFSSLQEVGEIYKIHGCCTEANTLVITNEDYIKFENRNAYLAAKLLTVFLEHPTIFIGYSISDTNVRKILGSVIGCLDQAQINELSKRLFFVQYKHDHAGEPLLDKYEFEIGGQIIPLTRIITSEFHQIYEVLSELHQKFPAGILRRMKEHIYELINTNDPTEKISVVDFNTDTDLEKVDVVIGVGIQGKKDKSYETYSRFDIAEDILFNDKKFDPEELCKKTLPKLVKGNAWIPVNKYYKEIKDKDTIDPKIKLAATRDVKEWKSGNPYTYKEKTINEAYNSISNIVAANTPEKAGKMILLLDINKVDVKELRKFLIENKKMTSDIQNSSYYMKLVSLLDRLENG